MDTLQHLLTPQRTVCQAAGASKKRLLEIIAGVIAADQESLSQHDVLTQLIAREKLGSTGLGNGIAIPHCRMPNCSHPLGALVTLEEPVDFDAPDGQPVDLLFVLLVPEEAQQQHLDTLAGVARLFSQDDFCAALRAARTDRELFQLVTTWDQ